MELFSNWAEKTVHRNKYWTWCCWAVHCCSCTNTNHIQVHWFSYSKYSKSNNTLQPPTHLQKIKNNLILPLSLSLADTRSDETRTPFDSFLLLTFSECSFIPEVSKIQLPALAVTAQTWKSPAWPTPTESAAALVYLSLVGKNSLPPSFSFFLAVMCWFICS